MNSLGYTLLSMLVRKPCSGYELKGYLELFWQAHHSQIYPLLNKLEKLGYVVYISENDPIHKKSIPLQMKEKNSYKSGFKRKQLNQLQEMNF